MAGHGRFASGTLNVRVTRDDDGALFATVVELPGVFASGFDPYELQEALYEAIGLYFSDGPFRVTFDANDDLAEKIAAGEASADGYELLVDA